MKTENENLAAENTPAGGRPTDPTPGTAFTPNPTSRRSRYIVIGSALVVLAAGLVAGIIPRVHAQGQLAARARAVVIPEVDVATATRADRPIDLTLPGDTHAYEETEIFARADGYLLKWNTDIGAKVAAGQVLAQIDTPELDQELLQSQAELVQAEANLALARSTAERWQALLKDHAVSQQEVDEKNGALAARAADVKAAQAAVSRLENLASYKEVRAPFAGTVTRRFVDTGALIHGGGSGNASALFELARMDMLRVHVNVPQAYLRDVKVGSPVAVRVAEFPDRVFPGKVVRTSGAFDPATRTLLTEIEVANQDGTLFPGIHVTVDLSLEQAAPPLVVSETSVMNGSDGSQIALVDDADAIHLQKVQLGRDFGKSVEIVGGLREGARFVTNPTDNLANGMRVKVAGAPRPKTTGSQVAKL
jgi:RND family efflux transporter MFP subunit